MILAVLLEIILQDKSVDPEVTMQVGYISWFQTESVIEGMII